MQFRKLSLDALVLHHSRFNGDKLLAITRGVDKRAKAGIALDLARRQVDDSLVEFVLSIISALLCHP